jgi:tetratricopeptide (TPR) repeat protein
MQSRLLLIAWCVLLGAIVVSLADGTAIAVMSGDESERAPPSDDDYAKGKAAFDREDWPEVIDHMTKVIARRPWHDDAHNLMGFAYRKLGDYDKALEAYDRALELNPHHRGALEYLGEAYLELDRPGLAKDMLDRLAAECQRIAVGVAGGGWQSGCEEWQELNEAYRAYIVGGDGD